MAVDVRAFVLRENEKDLARIDATTPGWMSFVAFVGDPENQLALASLGNAGKELVKLARKNLEGVARKGWVGSLPAKLLPEANRDLSGGMGGGTGKRVVDSGATVVREKAAATEGATRFIDGVKVVDKKTGQVFQGTVDLGPTLDRIKSGGSFPHGNDGTIFLNRAGDLPHKQTGYYIEYVHPTPGISGPGPQRIIVGKDGEMYYTADHYKTFIFIKD